MNRIVLISMVAASALFADMMTDVAKDVAVSKAKTEAKSAVINQAGGKDSVAGKVIDKVAPEPSPTDKIKSAVADKVIGTETESNASIVDKVVEGTSGTQETSMKDKAVDMAVEKAVGSNPLKKAAAKKAVESLTK